jgi:hypothetical protein
MISDSNLLTIVSEKLNPFLIVFSTVCSLPHSHLDDLHFCKIVKSVSMKEKTCLVLRLINAWDYFIVK